MRYKEFNSKKVLEDCISLFWDHGFGSCSIKDIVSATKVNRFSLYEEFENKEGILLSAMRLYIDRHSNPKLELLNQDKPLNEVLADFYLSFIQDELNHPPGCFIIHVATELADNNEDVKLILDQYLSNLEGTFENLLEKHKTVSGNSSFLAKHLTGLFCSLTTSCVIHSFAERKLLVNSGISMLLKNHLHYASNT